MEFVAARLHIDVLEFWYGNSLYLGTVCRRATDFRGRINYIFGLGKEREFASKKLLAEPLSRTDLLGHLCKLVCKGVDHELESIGDAELGIDRAEMVSNSGRTDEESFGDLFVL